MYMNKQEVIQYGLSLPNTYENQPFSDDYTSVVLKHNSTNKWFALVMEVKGEWYLNVKTDPLESEILRKAYSYIIPAYHMNKEHWNTIILGDVVDEKIVQDLIKESYELTMPQKGRKKI